MAEETTQEQTPKRPKTMLIVILIIVVNLIVVGGVVVFAMGKTKSGAEAPSPAEAAHTEKVPGPLMPMDNFIVNVRDEESERFLKASIVVELKVEAGAETGVETEKEVFIKWEKLLRNEVLVYLSSLEIEQTQTARQKRSLEEKITGILNKRIGTELIAGVYFTEFVTQ